MPSLVGPDGKKVARASPGVGAVLFGLPAPDVVKASARGESGLSIRVVRSATADP
jgi:hypothetical protein